MTHGCGACLAILIIILIVCAIIGGALILLHPEIGVKLKEIWTLVGEIWKIVR
jgi:hypothetical protein